MPPIVCQNTSTNIQTTRSAKNNGAKKKEIANTNIQVIQLVQTVQKMENRIQRMEFKRKKYENIIQKKIITQEIDRNIYKKIIKRNSNIMDNLSILTAIRKDIRQETVQNSK
jgi:hypothetical protein